jgi:hypothetical protein
MSVTGLGRIATAEKMSVSQLQEALKNKTLPAYIAVPLLEEKMDMQERMQKSAMMQQQAQQQQQAPIADRVMQRAAMAPGIDRLPTNLAPTQEYAGGGIVAFGEGGEVEKPIRFQNEGLVPKTQEETDREEMLDTLRRMKAAGMDVLSLPGRAVAGAAESMVTRPLRALGVPVPYLPRAFYGGDESSMTPYYDVIRKQDEAKAAAQATTATPASASAPAATTTPPPAVVKPKGGTAATGALPPAKNEGIAAGRSTPFAFEPRPEFPKLGTSDAMDVTQGIMGGPTGATARSEKREKELAEALGKNKMQGKAFDTYEESLKKEGEQAGLDKDQAKYMAMLKAGLAIMSGTSRHALENIGKGAMVGATDYQEAYKDFRKAQRERTKEFALIEQARRAEQRDDNKTANELLMRAADKAQSRDDEMTRFMVNAGITDVGTARTLAIEQHRGDLDWAKNKNTIGAQIDIHDKDRESRERISREQLRLQGAQVANQAAYYSKSLALTEQRIRAMDAATQAKYMTATQKILDGMQSDSQYTALVKGLKERYGNNWATIPEAQRAIDGFKKTYVGQQLESMNMLVPAARDATELIGTGQ